MFIFLSLILTTLHYFNIINEKITDILKLGLPILVFIITGYKLGKNSNQKGWLIGIKLALLTIILFTLLVLIFKLGFNLKMIIYYTIIIVSSMIGSILGINVKKEKEN